MGLKRGCPLSLDKTWLQQEEEKAENASLLVLENTKLIVQL